MTTIIISRSPRLFQERRIPGDFPTRRLPGMRTNLDRCKVHQIPLSPPFPLPDVLRRQAHPPDAGLTRIWPYGSDEIT